MSDGLLTDGEVAVKVTDLRAAIDSGPCPTAREVLTESLSIQALGDHCVWCDLVWYLLPAIGAEITP